MHPVFFCNIRTEHLIFHKFGDIINHSVNLCRVSSDTKNHGIKIQDHFRQGRRFCITP